MSAITDVAILAAWVAGIAWAVLRKPARRRTGCDGIPQQRPRSRPRGPRAGGALPSERLDEPEQEPRR